MAESNSKSVTLIVEGKSIVLNLFAEKPDSIIELADAKENAEAPIQIIEGHFYEYNLTIGYVLEPSEVVTQSRINQSTGRISPNTYVGTLSLPVLNSQGSRCGEVKIEVQSTKSKYRSEYRFMLEEITDKCMDLLMHHSSPVSQNVEINFDADANTLYQRFAFLKSVLDSEEFKDSVHKILSAPVSRWKETEIEKDIRGVRRMNSSLTRQIGSAKNRLDLPNQHPLKSIVCSIPARVRMTNKIETVDTQENRFIKFALEYFQTFVGDFRIKAKSNPKVQEEAKILEDNLEQVLGHSVFKEIGRPTVLPLNSPVLQRKEGYREVLRVWLMIDLAAKLIWHGGDDVYSAGKRDVAILYEYWVFFKLVDLVKEVFKIDSKSIEDLIEKTDDGLLLKLKQGKHLPIEGDFISDSRKLNIQFSYNRTFGGSSRFPKGGSWTSSQRPDYTLSIWPKGINQEQAEHEDLIVHIHFDAKYKVNEIGEILGEADLDESNELTSEALIAEKNQQKKGIYKRADLLKMHAYRDAIRRTGGAYVIYPGSETLVKQGFHELLPGLGAFSLRPSRTDSGSENIKSFLLKVVEHFLNRTSQREKIALKTYETYFSQEINILKHPLPENFGPNRSFQADETFVLVGFFNDQEHLAWYIKEGLYNFRTGTDRGSLPFGRKETEAEYLLLHTHGKTKTDLLFKIKKKGPRIFSKNDLIKKKYPGNPGGELYLVYELGPEIEIEFKNKVWDVTKLQGFTSNRGSGIPFTTTIAELMGVVSN